MVVHGAFIDSRETIIIFITDPKHPIIEYRNLNICARLLLEQTYDRCSTISRLEVIACKTTVIRKTLTREYAKQEDIPDFCILSCQGHLI